jgi:hypothetical protein
LQLEFESLKRIAPLADKRMGRSARVAAGSKGGARTASLKSVFEEIESFLNKVIGEYQHKRHLVPDSGEIPLLNFPKLGSFLDTDTFRESTSDNINNIVAALQTGLLTP